MRGGFKTLALTVRVLGALIGYTLNLGAVNYKLISLKEYRKTVFFGSMWFMPFISTQGIRNNFLKRGSILQGAGDIG